jgi:uncharacterized repeat protein (TIGR03803 family)
MRMNQFLPTLLCICSLAIVAAISSPAQTLTTIVNFNVSNGADPLASLIQGADGNLYGTTAEGGPASACPNGCGTLFKLTPTGVLTQLSTFCSRSMCADGANPETALVQAPNGNFYGTTYGGGAHGFGTVFKITAAGSRTILYSFCAQTNCSDGSFPLGGLVLGRDGNFYGTTTGSTDHGSVFKIAPNGVLTTLYSFCSQTGCTDGLRPQAGLIQARDGNFYGTTTGGGSKNIDYGTIFKITPSGVLTTLHSFNGADGFSSHSGLLQAADGNFYGTVAYGGNRACVPYGCGTIFRMSSTGKFTTLHVFNGSDGANPFAGLVQGSDGNFYGTTEEGGDYGFGTVFKITANGTLTILHSFNNTDGAYPIGGLVQATDGSFYGTTSFGGPKLAGTIYKVSIGLDDVAGNHAASSKSELK